MSVSEKSAIFSEMNIIAESLEFINSNLKSLSIQDKSYTVSFLRGLLPKIDAIQCKVKCSLQGQKDAIKGIQDLELIVLTGKLKKTIRIFKSVSAQIASPGRPVEETLDLFEKEVQEIIKGYKQSDIATKKSAPQESLTYLEPVSEADQRWRKLVQEENDKVEEFERRCKNPADMSQDDRMKTYIQIERIYLEMKATFKAPFLRPYNEPKIKEKLKQLEILMQKVIDGTEDVKAVSTMKKWLEQSTKVNYPYPETVEKKLSLLDDLSMDI